MLSLRPNHLAFLCLFHCLFLALVPTNAVPLSHRQANLQAATTVATQSTATTAVGDMTQTCVIALTPITDSNGNPAVQEVRTCTLTMGAADNNGSTASNSTDSSSTTTSTADSSAGTDTTTDSGSSSTDTSGSSTDSGSSSTDTSGSSTDTTAAASTAGAVVANGVSSVPAPTATGTDSAASAVSTDATASASPAAGVPAVSANAISSIAATDVATVPANSAATPAAESAAEQASASASAFTVPGQTLQVLPIGLGVFAGISVIALIVVGLVTYERTKYRKAFRARKLAESGAGMGYGGMAQR